MQVIKSEIKKSLLSLLWCLMIFQGINVMIHNTNWEQYLGIIVSGFALMNLINDTIERIRVH